MTTPSDNMTTVTCLFKQTRLRVTWWWRGENIGKSSLTDIILDKKLLLCQLKEKDKLRKKGRAQAAMFHLYLENTPSTISSSMFQDLSASWLPPLSFWIKSRVSAWTPLQRFVVHKSSVSVVLGEKKKKKKRSRCFNIYLTYKSPKLPDNVSWISIIAFFKITQKQMHKYTVTAI